MFMEMMLQTWDMYMGVLLGYPEWLINYMEGFVPLISYGVEG